MLNCARENFKVGFVLAKCIGHINVIVGNIDILKDLGQFNLSQLHVNYK